MEKQLVDNIFLESLVSTTSLEFLARGYILNCKTEGKSRKTISGTETILRNLSWYCNKNNFSNIQRITAFHISDFLLYLATQPNRWDSTSPAARKPESKTTVNCYYRSLRIFFNWLEREEFIRDNPFNHLKTPKTDKKVI